MPYEREDAPETEWDERTREMRRVPRRRKKREKRAETGGPRSGRSLLTVQLIACLAVLIAAAGLRFFGGELYGTVRGWYWEHLENSILTGDGLEDAQKRFWELFPPDGAASSGSDTAASSGPETSVSSAADSSAPEASASSGTAA